MLNFKEWLYLTEQSRTTRGKAGLYPSLYTQYYNYPPADVVMWSADAITYMDPQDLQFKVSNAFYTPYIRKDAGNPGKAGKM